MYGWFIHTNNPKQSTLTTILWDIIFLSHQTQKVRHVYLILGLDNKNLPVNKHSTVTIHIFNIFGTDIDKHSVHFCNITHRQKKIFSLEYLQKTSICYDSKSLMLSFTVTCYCSIPRGARACPNLEE